MTVPVADTSGPAVPPPPPVEPERKPRGETRKRMSLWDRSRLLLLFVVLWFITVWASMADNPLLPFSDAALIQLNDSQWLIWLAGLELLRQIHFFICERSPGYYRFWSKKVFGGTDRAIKRRFSDWTRYRLSRLIKLALLLVLAAVVAGQILDTSPILAIFQAPALLYQALPLILQLLFAFFFIAFQFIGLFWLLSRGGVDTYYPDDIKTRFSDVWGQDHVVERVKENIVFLEDPDSIEEKGGYVPSGMLLWGPPGTGKTLMAEAVAGETGQAVRVRRPGRVHQHVHGRRHPQGEVAVPQAAQARAALRRRDRLLRRGRRARQPRLRSRRSGRAAAAPGTARRSRARAATAWPTSPTTRAGCSPARRCRRRRSPLATAQPVRHGRHERHGRRRRHGHAAGAADRAVGAEEAARPSSTAGAGGRWACGPSRRPSTGSWS